MSLVYKPGDLVRVTNIEGRTDNDEFIGKILRVIRADAHSGEKFPVIVEVPWDSGIPGMPLALSEIELVFTL